MDRLEQSALIVEDNPALAESLVFALGTLGWSVVGPHATVVDALAAIASEPFDVAILDFDLGEETSVTIAARLRELGRPFLFMSGYEGFDALPLEYQNEICLPKPLPLDSLARELERLRTESSLRN